jgi:branched-chain amino acid transport system ATP-binding protein
MGAYLRRGRPDFGAVLAYFPWLESRRNQQAGTLSGGEQQMLALARAFLLRPKLLMLDEPSLGLAPLVTREVFRVVADLNAKEGLAVLVVEQNAAIALQAASRAYVLETGAVAVAGSSDSLKANDAVRSAYLGF